jgi:TetR/AcrR family transcriptional regulator, regulator of autoinduction and epiphytic fitness
MPSKSSKQPVSAATASSKPYASSSEPQKRGRPAKGEAVLSAAVAAFLERGYSGTTLELIAQTAGVSTATVFKHYRTKAEIFGVIMSQVFGNDDLNAWPKMNPAQPFEGLQMIGKLYADTIRDPNIRSLFRVMIAEVPRFPELGEQLYYRGKAPYLARVEDFLKKANLVGSLKVPDVQIATRQFLGMINDIVFWPYLLVNGLPDDDSEAQKIVQQAAQVICLAYPPSVQSRKK